MTQNRKDDGRARFQIRFRWTVIVVAAIIGWGVGMIVGPFLFEESYTGPTLGLGLGLAVGVNLVVRDITRRNITR